MGAFLLAALAGLAFGGLAVFVRTGLRRSRDPALAPVLIGVVAAGVAVAAAAATGALADASLADLWPLLAIGAAVPGASQILFVWSVRDAGASRAAVVIGTAPVISAALAVAFLDEPLRAELAVATVLIVAGGAALAREESRPAGFKLLGVVFALACTLLFAGRDNLVRAVVRDDDLPPLAATAASLVGAAVLLLAFFAITRRGRPVAASLAADLRAFAPAALCLALAYWALIAAFDRGEVTVVAPLNATQSLWAVVGSALFLGRSEAIGRRLVLAAVLVVAGSALIGATR